LPELTQMMTILLLGLGAVAVVATLVTVAAVRKAPEGYEDAKGFHLRTSGGLADQPPVVSVVVATPAERPAAGTQKVGGGVLVAS
jgi:hypothetical protein